MRLGILALALFLTGCAQDSGGASGSTSLSNTSWIAESVVGKPVVPPGAITLRFADGSVNGTGGCNQYNGSVTIKGDTIKFGNLASTLMACLEQGRMQQEAAYHELLRAAVRYERTNPNSLDIVATDGRRIVFRSTP